MALQIEELLAVQVLDTEIGRLEAEKAALDHGERVERALAVRQNRLQTAERRLQGLQIEQRNAELELKTLEEKKHQSSRKLYEGRITAPRELQALELEIAMLDRQRQRLDETLLRRLDEIENANRAAANARSGVEEAEKALRIVRRRYEKEATRIDGMLAEKQPARARLAAQIDPEALHRYDDLRRRNHNLGAARIENGACAGCRMKVGGAMLRRVMAHDRYVYCESCTRYLFPPLEE